VGEHRRWVRRIDACAGERRPCTIGRPGYKRNNTERPHGGELSTGRHDTLAEERHEAAKADPFYDEDKLRDDMRWAVLMGQDLAMWLGVPFTDQDGDTTNADQLAVHAVNRALADAITALPSTGNFEHVHQPIGQFGRFGKLQYRYAPNPMDLSKRFLELRLYTPSGKSSFARWVKQGTNDQVAAFLRFVRTPYTILFAMEELSRKLARDDYA